MGHDAVSVTDVGLRGAEDAVVFVLAVAEERVVVTENVADYAALVEQRQAGDEPCTPVVLVRKSTFPSGGALPSRLAAHLDRWARENPDPYTGLHWP